MFLTYSFRSTNKASRMVRPIPAKTANTATITIIKVLSSVKRKQNYYFYFVHFHLGQFFLYFILVHFHLGKLLLLFFLNNYITSVFHCNVTI